MLILATFCVVFTQMFQSIKIFQSASNIIFSSCKAIKYLCFSTQYTSKKNWIFICIYISNLQPETLSSYEIYSWLFAGHIQLEIFHALLPCFVFAVHALSSGTHTGGERTQQRQNKITVHEISPIEYVLQIARNISRCW